MNARELQKQFPYLTMAKLKSGQGGYKTERGWINHLKKLNAESEAKCNAPFVDHLEVTLTWRESKTWGLCPRADARWHDENGDYHSKESISYASGCGYDKQSSCLSSALNAILSRNLYEARRKMSKKCKEEGKIPYGLDMSDYDILPYFMGGCGVSSTMRCVAYIGGKIKHDVETKVMDKFVLDFKRPKK